MKFAAVICVLIALLGMSVGLKHGDCGQTPAIDGNGLIKCVAYIPSWSYYSNENECKEFVFGGCGGNENRFGSKQSCENKCKE